MNRTGLREIKTNNTLEYPKSHIFNRGAGLPSNKAFSNFKSRWHTCFIQKHQKKTYECSNLETQDTKWYIFLTLKQVYHKKKIRIKCSHTIKIMAYHCMAIADSRYQLLKEEASLQQSKTRIKKPCKRYMLGEGECKFWYVNLILTETTSIAYSLEKLSTRCIFHYNG